MMNGNNASNDMDGAFDFDGGAPSKGEGKSGLISYLAQLGLGDSDLANVLSLLPASAGATAAEVRKEAMRNRRRREDLMEAMRGEDLLKMAPRGEFHHDTALPFGGADPTNKRTVSLFLAEEQELLREAYLAFLTEQPSIEVLGYSGDVSVEGLSKVAIESRPDVLILGVKQVQAEMASTLSSLREASPKMGLVFLFAYYDAKGIKALRKFSNGDNVGCAYLLKHTIDTAEQFTHMIHAVSEGRIIVDPTVMEGLVRPQDLNSGLLPGLSPREIEVLSWMAKGYRNDTIAQVLSRDLRTVERHINSIYSKLEIEDGSKDPRVNAALSFLHATGSLAPEPSFDD
ncbi:MAG: hypothetical protein BZY88_14155 [SAR202 cluster bacterium Io17-Chloro-G9]|nr:MAG: hypothetical protein BZY88_14155 [SAR202 cluster bacterium Io17-Chloro-G9]